MAKFEEGDVVILNAMPDGKFVVLDNEGDRLGNPAPSSLHGALAIVVFESAFSGCWCVCGKKVPLSDYAEFDYRVHESQLLKA